MDNQIVAALEDFLHCRVRLHLDGYSCIRLGGDKYSPLHNINMINLIDPGQTPHNYAWSQTRISI